MFAFTGVTTMCSCWNHRSLFPDGDHYPIYLSETAIGGVKLSDRGHTLMHVSYDHDVDSFYEGARASLREQIVRESGIEEDEGIFSMETPAGAGCHCTIQVRSSVDQNP